MYSTILKAPRPKSLWFHVIFWNICDVVCWWPLLEHPEGGSVNLEECELSLPISQWGHFLLALVTQFLVKIHKYYTTLWNYSKNHQIIRQICVPRLSALSLVQSSSSPLVQHLLTSWRPASHPNLVDPFVFEILLGLEHMAPCAILWPTDKVYSYCVELRKRTEKDQLFHSM